MAGRSAYMSPEQAEGREVDARSDIFSMGVMLFEMATGHRPFTGDSSISVITAILRDTPAAVRGRQQNLVNHGDSPRHAAGRERCQTGAADRIRPHCPALPPERAGPPVSDRGRSPQCARADGK